MARPRNREQPPDQELVARCARGDDRAWRELVDRYRRLIYTIPYRMGLDPDEADDVFQITFTRLAERIDRLERPDRVRAWLVTTARRLSLGLVAKRTPDDSEEILARIEDPGESPSDEVARLEDEQLVRQALLQLGARCAELLSLLYFPQASGAPATYEEVSARLDMPIGSIGPTRMRCLKKLRAEFDRILDAESP
ncbi:MAG: sigma-70 family RNA polymerase sigma factor [Gemmatimonadetes bacterium]|nr:sigma-70 family RNA polymerase sigma factor [Gemmatimonadota bacterium]